MPDSVYKALADPTRRAILRILSRGEMSAGELSQQFDMSKPSMSHHFSVLKEADLVSSRRDGQKIFYSLNTTVVQDAITWLWSLFAHDAVSPDNGHSEADAAGRASSLSAEAAAPASAAGQAENSKSVDNNPNNDNIQSSDEVAP